MTAPGDQLRQLAATFGAAARDIHPAAQDKLRAQARDVEAQAAGSAGLGTGAALTYGQDSATVHAVSSFENQQAQGAAHLDVDAAAASQRLAGEVAGVGVALLKRKVRGSQ